MAKNNGGLDLTPTMYMPPDEKGWSQKLLGVVAGADVLENVFWYVADVLAEDDTEIGEGMTLTEAPWITAFNLPEYSDSRIFWDEPDTRLTVVYSQGELEDGVKRDLMVFLMPPSHPPDIDSMTNMVQTAIRWRTQCVEQDITAPPSEPADVCWAIFMVPYAVPTDDKLRALVLVKDGKMPEEFSDEMEVYKRALQPYKTVAYAVTVSPSVDYLFE